MDVLEAAQNLVDERLEMGIGQRLAGTDDGCQVAFHELCVNISTVSYEEGESRAYPRKGSTR